MKNKRININKLKEIQNKLEKLSEDEIDKLADIMDVGFLDREDSIDKEDKIVMLSTESKEKIIKSLKRLKTNGKK